MASSFRQNEDLLDSSEPSSQGLRRPLAEEAWGTPPYAVCPRLSKAKSSSGNEANRVCPPIPCGHATLQLSPGGTVLVASFGASDWAKGSPSGRCLCASHHAVCLQNPPEQPLLCHPGAMYPVPCQPRVRAAATQRAGGACQSVTGVLEKTSNGSEPALRHQIQARASGAPEALGREQQNRAEPGPGRVGGREAGARQR